jgi:hypothetical protein
MKDRVQCDERDCEARVMTREIEGQLLKEGGRCGEEREEG